MFETLKYLLIVLGILLCMVTIAAGLIWLERRMLALWQDRYGPNRTGPFGTLQVVADMIKIFFKEDWIPKFADKKVFILAPALLMITILMSFAIVPFTSEIVVVKLNIGILFFSRHVFVRRLQCGTGWMGFQQQICPVRCLAWICSDDFLRSFYGIIFNGSSYTRRLL